MRPHRTPRPLRSPLLSERLATKRPPRSGCGPTTLDEFLDVAAGGDRGVEKLDAAGFGAGVLRSMGDVAREERAGAGPADGNGARMYYRRHTPVTTAPLAAWQEHGVPGWVFQGNRQ